MYNMEIMPKMAIIIAIILIAIMIKVLSYFHMPALINLQKSILQFIKKKKKKIQTRSNKKFKDKRTKLDVKNTHFPLLQSQS